MFKDFSSYNSECTICEAVRSFSRIWLEKILWLVGAVLLGLLFLRVAPQSPQDMRNSQVVAKLLAREQANTWSAEERRLQAVIEDTRQRYVQFRRGHPGYSQTIVDETREQMVRHIALGMTPSKALAQAVQEAERGGQLQVTLAD